MGRNAVAFAATSPGLPPRPMFDDETERCTRKRFCAGDLVADRYEIRRFIAQGGMGEVYEAYDLELREPIALKTLLPEIARNADAAFRFKREIRLARRISHPGICRIHELGSDERGFFFTMEYLEGETLAERIARRPLTQTEAMPIARQIAEAVAAAHHAGILHRDLKPANIMLTPALDGGLRVVVTDFGLARTASEEISVTRGIIGTPEYMSPEQVLGGELGPRSDVYAFGVVLYEMLTGQVPFGGNTAVEIAAARLKKRPVSPRQLGLPVDRKLDELLMHCLERDPELRPSSFETVRTTLDLRAPRRPHPALMLLSLAVAVQAFLGVR